MGIHGKNGKSFAGVILMAFAFIGLWLGYLIIEPIFIPLLFAALFAVVFMPTYDWFVKKTKSPILSSLICSLILSLGVLSLISFAIYLAVGEVVSITKVFTQNLDFSSVSFLTDQAQIQAMIDQAIVQVDDLVESIPFVDTSLSSILTEVLKNIPPFLQDLSTTLIGFVRIGFDSAANIVINLMIFFIAFFFLLIDGRKFMNDTFRLLPINALHERQITKRFTNLCFSWIVVSFALALIQGIFAAIGFAIIGVPSPLIWGVITMFASFLPFVGSLMVWGSVGLIYLILGYYGSALFIIIWGITFISSSDNLLRPFLLRGGVEMHPLILFLAVLGGFYAFGVPGLIIGPIAIVFISTLLYIYELEFGDALKSFHSNKR
ncbi:MAG: AI-2E family transporter [Candidatus Gracilibacteria bacterium]|nr:AI-2E family transporter [Candidatus Gracilibacteria bacterium]